MARRVSKEFTIRHNSSSAIKDRAIALIDARRRERVESFWALRDLSVTVQPGEAVAIIGRNGSGKSTFLKLVAGLMSPTSGAIFVRRGTKVGTMIELGVGFHPELTALENVSMNASIHGLSPEAIDAILPAIVEYSGLANFMDQPLRNFSSGMYTRLGFAVAANLKPDLLLLDEVFAVGDADFQARCTATMREIRERGATVLFVSHSPAAVRQVCGRAIVLDAGALVFDGPVEEGLDCYTGLMRADRDVALPGARSRPAPAPDAALRDANHRLAMGANWEALGPWARDFLRAQGLESDQFFLDLGCGSLPVAVYLLPLMAPARYWGVEGDASLLDAGISLELARAGVLVERGHFLIDPHFDLAACPHAFTIGLAHSMAHRVTPDEFARAVGSAVTHFVPGGRLFVAAPASAGAHIEALRRFATAMGVLLEPVQNAGHPDGDEVYRITRKIAA